METKRASSQEPTSGKSSKRGFDEIDSDTADEEDTQGDVSPSKSLRIRCVSSELTRTPFRFEAEEGAVVATCAERVLFGHICGPCAVTLISILTYLPL